MEARRRAAGTRTRQQAARRKKADKVKLRARLSLCARARVSPRNLQTLVRGPPTVKAALPPRTLRQLAAHQRGEEPRRGAREGRKEGGGGGGGRRRSSPGLEVSEQEEEEEERVVVSRGARTCRRRVSHHGRSQAGSPCAAAQTRVRPRSAEEGRKIHQVGRGEMSLFVCTRRGRLARESPPLRGVTSARGREREKKCWRSFLRKLVALEETDSSDSLRLTAGPPCFQGPHVMRRAPFKARARNGHCVQVRCRCVPPTQ